MNYKKIVLILFCILLVLCLTKYSYADDMDELDEENLVNIVEDIEISNEIKVQEPKINSRRYVVYDRASGLCVYGKDQNKQTAMASTTKIMTALVVLESCEDLNEIVTISIRASSIGGSKLGLKQNDKITVNDLLYGMLLRSGNDCAIALAEYTSGNVEEFAELMNNKTKELNLENTHFVTPHGLDDPNHYTTAFELAKLTDYALKNQQFLKIVGCKYATIYINDSKLELNNTNELLSNNVEGVYGVKTGFTNNAGRCLVTAIKRNNMDLIIVVLGADTRKYRAQDTIKLTNYVIKKYNIINVEEYVKEEFNKFKEINRKRIYINKSSNSLDIAMKEIKIKSIVTDSFLKVDFDYVTYLESPVNIGTRIGTANIYLNDILIEEVPIITTNTVYKRNIFDYLKIYATFYSY